VTLPEINLAIERMLNVLLAAGCRCLVACGWLLASGYWHPESGIRFIRYPFRDVVEKSITKKGE